MGLDSANIDKRMSVWRVLSDLFLDTELQAADYAYIADRLGKTEFSVSEIQEILWNEVFPALGDNLRIIAGAWSGFEDKWLRERMTNVMRGSEPGLSAYGLITEEQTREIINDAWLQVLPYLPHRQPD